MNAACIFFIDIEKAPPFLEIADFVNGVVLHGRCHLNASAIIKGLAGPVFKLILHRIRKVKMNQMKTTKKMKKKKKKEKKKKKNQMKKADKEKEGFRG
ncbi:hypothetical protein M8J77_006216 [Diaphorina citri]|nr:hypothetical protein M8J77_006216 [Diaphorina citri]